MYIQNRYIVVYIYIYIYININIYAAQRLSGGPARRANAWSLFLEHIGPLLNLLRLSVFDEAVLPKGAY